MDIDPELLGRYLDGTATPAEQARMDALLEQHAEWRAEVERLREVLALDTSTDRSPRELDRWADQMLALAAEQRSPGRATSPGILVHPSAVGRARRFGWLSGVGQRHTAPWALARVAAVIAIIVLGVGGAWRAGWFASQQQFREFASARGSRTTITLRDGTRLVLGPETRLRVPGDFGRTTRTVELDGEALLTVVHDPLHPFAVRTAHATVRDVGTTFVVRAYANDPTERVVVTEGEVAVAGVTLTAQHGASVDAAGRITVQRAVDLASELAWVQGGLAFNDTPLREAVRAVARLYDVEVTIADSALGDKPITVSFRGEPVDQVLREIAFAVGGHYERVGRAIVIRRGIRPASQRGAEDQSERLARAGGTR